jgi:AhpD family alkylhydroperoxidase
MKTRMKNPALILGVNPAIQSIISPIYQSGISPELLEYIGLRVGQMNNCELCIDQAFVRAEKDATTKDRIEHVLDWKKSNLFNEAEQAALEVAEAITELKDKYNSVPDSLWLKVENHYNETQIAALVLFISIMNMFTRINVATRQLTADW